MGEPLPPVPLRLQRERTIALLCEHFARDHLETEELERLIDRAHGARTVAELEAVLDGLPALADPRAAQAPLPARPAREQELVVAVMGGAERKGGWAPARNVNVVALMGGVVLDFRQARLGPGVTEIRVAAVMGGVEIVVPPEFQVESDGIGIMGSFDHHGQGRHAADGSAPVLRVTGAALMGEVQISVRLAGESARDARRRRREARRDLRAQRHGSLGRGDDGGT